MLAGHIDSVTSSGYIEGWAFDRAAPARPLLVAVRDDGGEEVAWGLAHRYREDLVTAQCGIGWCAFQLRAAVSVARLRRCAVVLACRATGQQIHRADPAAYLENSEPLLNGIAALTESDPTLLSAVEQLRGCEAMFAAFVKEHGVDAFVRAAYLYVLARPYDASGRALYGRLLHNGLMTPYNLLRALYDSDEFRSRPRLLSAPNTAAFPFHGESPEFV